MDSSAVSAAWLARRKMSTIAVLGAGAWGTALAVGLARGGHRVTLCARRADHAAAMRARRENAAYLPGIALPQSIELSDRWAEVASASETVLMAVPSRFARAAMTPVGPALGADATLVSVTKGIESDSLKTMTAMLAEVAPAVRKLAVLSGPSFAAEVARGKPAAVVAASRDETVSRGVQDLFASHTLRVYRSLDVDGVELAGAVKNVIAIAAGISDGLGLGSSARAADHPRPGRSHAPGPASRRARRDHLRTRGARRPRTDLHRRPFAQPCAGSQNWSGREQRRRRGEHAARPSGGRRCVQRALD